MLLSIMLRQAKRSRRLGRGGYWSVLPCAGAIAEICVPALMACTPTAQRCAAYQQGSLSHKLCAHLPAGVHKRPSSPTSVFRASAGGPALLPSLACVLRTRQPGCFLLAYWVRALWQAHVDRKPAPVPLPRSPEAPDAPPSGVEWMDHDLKLGAGPESPTSSYFVEDVRPKVCLPEAGRQCMNVLLISVCIAGLLMPCGVCSACVSGEWCSKKGF